MRLKHNKKRNTAFLYEMLTREVVKSIIKKDLKKRNVTISLIKENFAKNTELRKELDLYKALLEFQQRKRRMGRTTDSGSMTESENVSHLVSKTEVNHILKTSG